jgi:hypothetical protein
MCQNARPRKSRSKHGARGPFAAIERDKAGLRKPHRLATALARV